MAELGVLSLQGKVLQELLDAAVRLAAEGLGAQLCKVLEYIPAENRLLMRAGVGWDPGLVGVASVGVLRISASSLFMSPSLSAAGAARALRPRRTQTEIG